MLQIMRKVKETGLARTVVNVWKTKPLAVTPLVAASKRLDVEEVQKLLTIEQHTRVEEMNRALRKVAYAEDDDEDRSLEIISLLLENGAEVNGVEEQQTFPTNWTALHSAAYRLKKNTVLFLIQKGADADMKDTQGLTALHWAARADFHENATTECVKRLLDNKSGLDMTDLEGNTAFHWALHSGEKQKHKVAVQLLDHGADAMVANRTGWTGLTVSLYWNMPDVARKILQSTQFKPENIDLINEEGETPLGYATAYCMTNIVPLLLCKGASLYKQGVMYDFCDKQFEIYLDSCINYESKEKKISDSTLQLDYSFLRTSDDSKDDNAKEASRVNLCEDRTSRIETEKDIHDVEDRESAPIPEVTTMVETRVLEDITSKHRNLLKHPMIRIFLTLKYQRISNIYQAWVAMKILFLCLLVVLVMKNFYQPEEDSVQDNFLLLVPFSTMLLVFIIAELLQILVSVSSWVLEIKNWLQTFILATSTYMVWCLSQSPICRDNLGNQLFGFLLPLAYYEFLHDLGTPPRFSKYIHLL